MPRQPFRSLVQQIRHLAGRPAAPETSDADLLDRWLSTRDDAAFELIVWRHGGMVLDLCHRLLPAGPDAEDAFQATFLILVEKAHTVRNLPALASWLYKVAFRTALAARARAARQRAAPLSDDAIPAPESADNAVRREQQAVLAEEIERLPERYRVPVVLCYLQGMTVDEAAAALGCARWTLATRLQRAKDRLHRMLARRKVALSAAALATMLAAPAAAAPAPLVQTTVQAALAFAKSAALPLAALSPGVAALVQDVTRARLLHRLTLAAGFAALGLILGGAGFMMVGNAFPTPGGVASHETALPAGPVADLPHLVVEAVNDPIIEPEPGEQALDVATVTEVAAVGREVRLQFAREGGASPRETQVRIDEQTHCQFSWVARGEARPAVGYQAARAYVRTPGEERLSRVHFNGRFRYKVDERTRRPADYAATVVEVSPDQGAMVLEINEEPRQPIRRVSISLMPQTQERYHRVPFDGAQPTPGYRASVWLVDGSAEQAAVVWFTGPGK